MNTHGYTEGNFHIFDLQKLKSKSKKSEYTFITQHNITLKTTKLLQRSLK